jgi:hypothetical protein
VLNSANHPIELLLFGRELLPSERRQRVIESHHLLMGMIAQTSICVK